MNFLSPSLLWSLLALLPLAAIYFLKVRPRKRATTAYFLWEKIFSEKKASSLFNRLRDLLSLLLMALAFAMIAFALAQPELRNDTRKDLLILIDQSASMAATEHNGTSRLELAKSKASDLVIALGGNQRAAIAGISRDLTYHSHFSGSPRALTDAIDGIQQSNFPFDIKAISSLSSSDSQWVQDYRILLLTDGSFAGAGQDFPTQIEVIKIGEPLDNVGFVAADLQSLPGNVYGFYFRIASSFKKTVKADLILKNLDAEAGRIFKYIPLEISPGENEAEIFEIEDAPPGRWTASLDIDDALDKDNTAYLTVPAPQPIRVAVAAENRYFFETSILAFEQGTGKLKLVASDDAPDIVISQHQTASSAKNNLIFTPSDKESVWWEKLGEEIDAIAPRILIEDHPMLRNVDITTIDFLGAREIEPVEGALILVESEDGVPLIYKAKQDGNTALIVNLDPVASEFYFSAWFPALIHGATTHLSGRENDPATLYRPGDIAPIPGYHEDQSSTITLPDASTLNSDDRQFGPLKSLGFYQISNPGGEWPLGVSLSSPAESNLDNSSLVETVQAISSGHPPAYWLIVLAILLLTGESILYHRRKVG
ncbi:MAG: VWA domain-containing protein [Verrucomicrobiales bacterium]|nr:VWA domain-containing protein [Verrucomicrobiales bacterium]